MANLEFAVVRPDNLLVLRFECVNLAIAPGQSPPALVRISQDDDALVIVYLPPQHIAERSFDQSEDGSLPGLPGAGISLPAFSAGESRLVFRLPPDGEPLPLSVEALLDWSTWTLVNVLDEADAEGDIYRVSAPSPTQTSIELPLRLILTNTADTRWQSATAPVQGGVTELWHARLMPAQGTPALWLHAIWSPDGKEGQDIQLDLQTTLTQKDRSDIVGLSSDLILLDPRNFNYLDEDLEALRVKLDGERDTLIRSQRLMLSALGGSLRVRSSFYFPSSEELGPLRGRMIEPQLMGDGDDQIFSLVDWQHDTVWGRDQAATVIAQGHLYPFGHEATLIVVHRREIRATSRDPGGAAYLVRRTVIALQQLERTYDTGLRDFPFSSIQLTEPQTPLLDTAPSGPFVPRVNGQPYRFGALATDLAGRTHRLLLPMVFVPQSQTLTHDAAPEDIYAQEIGDTPIAGLEIAFADPGADPLKTALLTTAMRFSHRDQPVSSTGRPVVDFRPVLEEAQVRISALVDMLGREALSRIRYDETFLAKGFGGVGQEIFAQVIDAAPIDIPAEACGGLAAPSVLFDGLSRQAGTVANAAAVAAGNVAAASLDFLKGQLLGAISLADIVAVPNQVADLAQLAPGFVRQALGSGQQLMFHWSPPMKIGDALPKPLIGTPTLALDVVLNIPASSAHAAPDAPHSDVRGTLQNFGLQFENLVELDFAALRFHMVSGNKPEFGADIAKFAFLGDLSFIDALSRQLPQGAFGGSGPSLAVTPQGVGVGVAIAIPTVGLGALTLTNLDLSAELWVYFFNPAELRFGLSSRQHPFLIAYLLLGGGGFFSVTVSSGHRSLRLEAALEFGLLAAIDLFVARGEVQAMVGIYFSLTDGRSLLEGYIRLFGSLEILDIVSISVEFYLGLSFDGEYAQGSARLVVSVRVLFFSKSLTLSVTRRINMKGGGVLSLAPSVPASGITEDAWQRYCRAFA
jgi:hypothetical protein